jgi:hypothetical protein
MALTFGSSFGFQSSSSGGGGGGNLNYVHTQSTPSNVWYVNHNLNVKCSVQVVDINQIEIVAEIRWDDNNNVTVFFNTDEIGYVYCNK